jgi:poly(3-hydroxybutyrate) depolymerase
MRYRLFDTYARLMSPINKTLDLTYTAVEHLPFSNSRLGRTYKAGIETAIRLVKHYPKLGFDYAPVEIEGVEHPVTEETVLTKPFCHLLHFRREGLSTNAPKVLFVAALSGHHATLSKDTFRAFLKDYDVYVTDWLDARDVPLSEGKFGVEEYVQYLEEFLEFLGPGTHAVGLCQAGPPLLCATAYMARHNNPARPASLTLIAAPIDNRVNPTNKLAKFTDLLTTKISFLKGVAIHKVPARYPGAGRRVYPGVLQLGGFMTLNLTSHIQKNIDFIRNIIADNEEDADKHRDFYDEYMAVLDMDADYYLETVERVFLEQQLPRGIMEYKGEKVDCGEITDVPILTMEGAEDDMVSIGQTQAALSLCPNLPARMKKHHVQRNVGHYGIFSGRFFRKEVVPVITTWINKYRLKPVDTQIPAIRQS